MVSTTYETNSKYMIGQDPIITQQTFQMQKEFATMEECKKELLLQTRNNGTYDVLWDFVNKGQFEWDWLVAGCKNDQTGEEFRIERITLNLFLVNGRSKIITFRK